MAIIKNIYNKAKNIFIKFLCLILSKNILKKLEFFSLVQEKVGIGNLGHEVKCCRN